MTKEEIRQKIREYLDARHLDSSDDSIDNFIYVAAYQKLMKLMYGDSPLDMMRASAGADSNVKNVPSQPSKPAAEKPASPFGGKIIIRQK